MQVFNRNVSVRGLTVFGFEVVLIAGSMALAASVHGSVDGPDIGLGQIALVTALCLLCFYYNDLYDLTIVHSNRELVVRLLQAAGAAAIVLAFAAFAAPSLIPGRSSPRSACSSSRCSPGASRSTISRATRTSRSAC